MIIDTGTNKEVRKLVCEVCQKSFYIKDILMYHYRNPETMLEKWEDICKRCDRKRNKELGIKTIKSIKMCGPATKACKNKRV